MNYPFTHQVIDKIDISDILSDLSRTDKRYDVWGDWHLQVISSDQLREWLEKRFPTLKIYNNTLFISSGRDSNFHIDRFEYHHLLHRIIIPLDSHFRYEWMVDSKRVSFQPESGDVILFNNMIPHRFITNPGSKARREVVYLDLIDEKLFPFIQHFQGNYSQHNGRLAELK